MRGDDKIIQARIRRQAPGAIYIIDYPDKSPLELGDVDVYGDTPSMLDFRFVIDMLVCVTSDNEKRMEQLVAQCRKFHARQIAYGLHRKYY
jgi:hypothetical protein